MDRRAQIEAQDGTPPREPWRRMLPGLLTLVIHAIILALLPGLVMPPVTSVPPPILIDLHPLPPEARHTPKAPADAGLEPETAGGMHAMSPEPQDGQAPLRKSAPGSNLHPQKPQGANPFSPSPSPALPAPPSANQANQANDVLPLPRAPKPMPAIGKPALPAPQPAPPVAPKPSPQPPSPVKPQQIPPSAPSAKPAPSKPTQQPGGSPAKPRAGSDKPAQPKSGGGQSTQPSAPGNAKPAPETSHPAARPAPGAGSGPSGKPGNGGGNTPGAPEIPAPEGRAAPDFGAPALPAGPGSGELNILDKYGDHCMAEIKKEARNPERAREKWHDQGDNWGTVTFEFEVDKTGKLLDVRILDDGGFAPFGQEVAEATRVAAQYFGPWNKYGMVTSVGTWTFKRKLKFPLY